MNARGFLEAMGILQPGQKPEGPVERESIKGRVLFEDELFLSVENNGEVANYFFLEGQVYLAEGFDELLANPDLDKDLATFGVEGLEE